MKLFLILASLIIYIKTLNNGLGLVPPMGWSSRDSYGCNVDQNIIKKTADILVSSKLASKGYKYIIIDGCWQGGRNSSSLELFPNIKRFPGGIKKLADYIHQKGLLLGLSSAAGTKTCDGFPGSHSYQKIDANTFANWEIDYLTYSNCYSNVKQGLYRRFYKMQKALNQTGRHIFFAMNEQGQNKPWYWNGNYVNSWRTTQDIQDNWISMTSILDRQSGLQPYAGKGGWNDPDLLQVGKGNMTFNEYYVQFAMWSILKSPLIIGANIQFISAEMMEILGNTELIAINQDRLGIQATRKNKQVRQQGTTQIWYVQITALRWVIAFLNLSEGFSDMQFNIKKLVNKNFKHYDIRNVIEKKDEGRSEDQYIMDTVAGRSINVYLLTFDSKTHTDQKVRQVSERITTEDS